MLGSAEETIRAAAEAYLSGDVEAFAGYLDQDATILGSEQRDMWTSREDVMNGLGPELQRRHAVQDSVTGSLIDHIRECVGVRETGDMALFSATGDLEIDGYYHRKASWTVVMNRGDDGKGEDWKIVHSHFSIHR